MSSMKDLHTGKEWSLHPLKMETTDDLIDWVLTVLSSKHLSEEELLKWWSEEIQFAIPHIEEK
ncbi:hypothetical protein CN378_09690 [Bacillus sp. AFS015802]|uniref:hypothetical protein n=1 Tax=Bacillus sp. AFS015802 TaxID=2033486 RepID=UPI000BF8A1AF|nr:hypothetical protein [Bacillus sp. AFS015802]PFA67784.1 hypothetical protein CN378_09690 [Bacillus sp. AFS015802]